MPQRARDKRSVEFAPEDAVMSKWLVDDGDYVTLERVRRPVQLEVPIRLDVHKAERA